jgi:polypyrimidine tract-binding protein 2
LISSFDNFLQQVTGPDGKKIELESNVLHANFENAQYPITVDVLHTVFSAFGVVQKIAIFEKNGGTQALIQYPDIATAKVAKGALEGHSIYDGGYCKIHLTYSRHTDLVVKAYSDKSRDYTVPIGGIGAMPRPPIPMSAAPNSWQNTGPVRPMYNGQMPPYPAGAVPFSGQAFPQTGPPFQASANHLQASQPGPPFQAMGNPHQASQQGQPFQASANSFPGSQPGPPSPASGNHLQSSQPMLFNGVQARPPHYYQ